MLEEAKALLREEKYVEAYECFKKHYDEYHDLESYFYMLSIDYYNIKDKTIEEYYTLFMDLKKKSPEKFLISFIHPLVSIAYELKDYNNIINVIREGEKQNILDGFLNSIMASALYESGGNLDLALEYTKKALLEENIDNRVKGATYETKALIYAKKNNKEQAIQTINEMFLANLNSDLVEISEFKVYIELGETEELEKILDKAIKTKENPVDYIIEASTYFERNRELEKSFKLISLLIEKYLKFFEVPYFLYAAYARIGNLNRKHIEVINFLDIVNLDDSPTDIKVVLLEEKSFAYSSIEDYKNAVKCFEECYNITKNIQYLEGVSNIYYDFQEYEEALKTIDLIKNTDSTYQVNFLLSKIYKELGDFNKAEEYCKKGKAKNDYYQFIELMNIVSKNPKKYYNTYVFLYSRIKNSFGYRAKANFYYHGCCNIRVNEKKAIKFAIKAYQLSPNYSCSCSMLGNIYLNMKEYDKAFELFEKGHKQYLKDKFCTCATAFYSYCMMMGYGTEKNEEKAYEILNEIADKKMSTLSENGVGILVYLSIKNNKDLNKLLEKVEKYYERRYSVTKYFSLVQIKKILNIDYTNDYNMFKLSLKFASKKEKNYYKKERDFCYLNNF